MSLFYPYNIFISRDRVNFGEFLEESPLWNELFELTHSGSINTKYLNTSDLKLFNEARYQCVRIFHDNNPEEDVKKNYLLLLSGKTQNSLKYLPGAQ